MSIELPENTAIKGEAGFTMIEVVMVLVLLGILGAVAVAKFYDLQEEASAIKCEYNRSVLVSQMNTAFAVSHLEENDDFSADKINTTIDNVMSDIGGSGCKSGNVCENLCPKSGVYTVDHTIDNGSIVFKISCNVHDQETVGPGTGGTEGGGGSGGEGETPSVKPGENPDGSGEGGSTPEEGPTIVKNPDQAKPLADYLFGLMGSEAQDPAYKDELIEFFTNFGTSSDWAMDSHCTPADGSSDTAKLLAQMLKDNDVVTENLIWRMQLKGDKIYLWVASLSKDDENEILNNSPHQKTTTVYQYTAKYDRETKTVTYNPSSAVKMGETTIKTQRYEKLNPFSDKYVYIDMKSNNPL